MLLVSCTCKPKDKYGKKYVSPAIQIFPTVATVPSAPVTNIPTPIARISMNKKKVVNSANDLDFGESKLIRALFGQVWVNTRNRLGQPQRKDIHLVQLPLFHGDINGPMYLPMDPYMAADEPYIPNKYLPHNRELTPHPWFSENPYQRNLRYYAQTPMRYLNSYPLSQFVLIRAPSSLPPPGPFMMHHRPRPSYHNSDLDLLSSEDKNLQNHQLSYNDQNDIDDFYGDKKRSSGKPCNDEEDICFNGYHYPGQEEDEKRRERFSFLLSSASGERRPVMVAGNLL